MDDGLIWKALSDPTRRRIMDILATGPRSTGDLTEQFTTLSRYAVMKHLGVLEAAHLVTHTRQGKRRLNYLNAVPLRKEYERWVSRLEDSLAGSLTTIGKLAEAEVEQKRGTHTMATEIRDISIHQEHRIAAEPDVVWKILITRIGEWWRVPYRMFREGSEMTIELTPGGRLVEQKGDAFVLWALVTAVHPGRSLELDGLSGVGGKFIFSIAEDGDHTVLTIDHNTIDSAEVGEEEGYSGGWEHLANGLKELAEAS